MGGSWKTVFSRVSQIFKNLTPPLPTPPLPKKKKKKKKKMKITKLGWNFFKSYTCKWEKLQLDPMFSKFQSFK